MRRQVSDFSKLIAPVMVCSFASVAHAEAKLDSIDVRQSGDRTEVVLTSNEPLTFQSWTKTEPATVVVDLLDTRAEPRAVTSKNALISAIQVSRHDQRGLVLSRISIDLAQAVDFDVNARGNTITVTLSANKVKNRDFKAKAGAKMAMATATDTASDVPMGIVEGSLGRSTAEQAVELAQADGPRQMSFIGFKNTSTTSRVYARLNAEAKFTVRKEGDSLVVLEIQNATIPLRNNKNHLDATYFDSPVKMITPSEVEDATPTIRITIEMKSAVPFESRLEGRDVVVTFKK